MNNKDILRILGIEEIKNEEDITQAYRDRLMYVNPEDDAEGFMELREAYEKAIRLLHEPEEKIDIKEKNDVDLWIDRVHTVCMSIKKRINAECWEELFRDDVCIGIDTNIEAREKLLSYLMEHYYLPYDIWQIIDREFDITANKEHLYELFPKNFIDYVVFHSNNESFLDYNLFDVVPSDDEDIDEYLRKYFNLKACIDQEEIGECSKIIEDLERYRIYHPYVDAEKIRFYIEADKLDEAIKLSENLISIYPEDPYILSVCAIVKNKQKMYDEAEELFQMILNQHPNYYLAVLGLLECLCDIKEYVKAKELLMSLPDSYHGYDIIQNYLIKINEVLIPMYKESLKEKEDNKIKLEMAWCLYQNQRFEESVSVLEELPTEIKSEYDFINLDGRAYLSCGKYKEALDKLKVWVKAILDTKKDESLQSKKRYARLGYAYYSIGQCYVNLESYDDAIKYFEKSVEVEEDYNKLLPMERIGYTFLKMKEFNKCVDICDRILEIDSSYYTAYLHRQEAHFELDMDQDVINDYHAGVQIFPGYIKPYILAIKVFIRHNQIDDARSVIDEAKKQGLDSNELTLAGIKIKRIMSETRQEIYEAIEECEALKHNLYSKDNDIEDPISVDYEMLLLRASIDEYGKALVIINSIIEERPKEEFYLFVKGRILRDYERYKEAIRFFNNLLDGNPRDERIYYEIGLCYSNQGESQLALDNFLKVVEINPNYSDVNYRIADIYLDSLKKSQNLEFYNKALPFADRQLNISESDSSYVCRGLLHMNVYEFDKALSDFYKAYELDNDNLSALNNIGYTYILMRNMDKAIETLEQVIERVSIESFRLPYSNMARAYHILKDYDRAITYYEMLHKAYPDEGFFIERLSLIYKNAGDLNKSIKWIKKLNKISAINDIKIKRELGNIYFLKGNKFRANIYYMAVLGDTNFKDYMSYGEFLFLNKMYSYGKIILTTSIFHSGYFDDAYIDASKNAGRLHWLVRLLYKWSPRIRIKTYDKKAIKYAGKVIKAICNNHGGEDEYIKNPSIRKSKILDLALIYLIMGDEIKAEEYLSLASNSYPCSRCYHGKCIRFYEIYGMLYESRDQLDKALDCYNILTDEEAANPLYIKLLKNAKAKKLRR